jgi:UDP-N-acetylmuramoyl-tripeptide--D-alanyl-D-alanine ligase
VSELSLAATARLDLASVLEATGGRLLPGASADGLAGVCIDSRTLRAGELFVAVRGPRFDGHEFLAEAATRGAAAALVDREVPASAGLPLIRVGDTTRALADLARHRRRACGVPVVAVTGSMGKTTTKEMLAALLATRGAVLKTEGNLNNRYGLPLTLLRLLPEHRAAALELGMSAAGELRELSAIAEPDVAVITNVAPVHLEFFASLDAIAAAKAEILEGLRAGGTAVLNGDDPRVQRIGQGHAGRVVWFGRDRRHDVSAENWRGTAFGMRFDLLVAGHRLDLALPLAGPHFVLNFLAAAAAAHVLGIEPEAMAEAASGMAPAPHRGEVLRLAGDVTLIDDSYNASPEAVRAASLALTTAAGRRRVAFLGDMLELGPTGPDLHREVGETVGGRVQVLVAVGTQAPALLEGARRAGLPESALLAFPDSSAAAAAAAALVAPGDAVLVKGSRGVRMEKVVEALLARFGRERG